MIVSEIVAPNLGDAKGTTSFKLENKDILESVIFSIGTKAKLKQRGEAYIRPKAQQAVTN